jgi:hypothetical protein
MFALRRKVDIDIAVEQLAAHLQTLNVKTVIVINNRFPLKKSVEALKKSSIANRVSKIIAGISST